MTTLDDMLEYKLGDKVVLFEAAGQNPKNSFKTGTVGKISEFYADGFLVKTNYGECIRTYLPFVCRKEVEKMTAEERQAFEKWFEEKKEKCEVYGNGDDFWVDDEIKKFCLMGYELGLKTQTRWHDLRIDPNDLPTKDIRLAIIEVKDCGYLLCEFREDDWYVKGSGAVCKDWIRNIKRWKEIELPKEIEYDNI